MIEDNTYETTHRVFTLLSDMNEKDLDVMYSLLSAIAYGKNPEASFSFYAGYIAHLKEVKFNICPMCKAAHEEGDRTKWEENMTAKLGSIMAELGIDIKKESHGGTYL